METGAQPASSGAGQQAAVGLLTGVLDSIAQVTEAFFALLDRSLDFLL